MTRINAGIEPVELSDSHLLAEHREICRIPNIIKSGKAKESLKEAYESLTKMVSAEGFEDYYENYQNEIFDNIKHLRNIKSKI